MSIHNHVGFTGIDINVLKLQIQGVTTGSKERMGYFSILSHVHPTEIQRAEVKFDTSFYDSQ